MARDGAAAAEAKRARQEESLAGGFRASGLKCIGFKKSLQQRLGCRGLGFEYD